MVVSARKRGSRGWFAAALALCLTIALAEVPGPPAEAAHQGNVKPIKGATYRVSTPPSTVSDYQSDLLAATATRNLPPGLVAHLSSVTNKNELYQSGCHSSSVAPGANQNDCVFANPNSKRTMWLIGDSHAAMWFPAVSQFARDHDLRLVVYTKSSCPIMAGIPYSPQRSKPYTLCRDYNDWLLKKLSDLKLQNQSPNVLLVAGYQGIQRPNVYQSGVGISRLAGLAENVVVLQDSPKPKTLTPACLRAHQRDILSCAIPFATAYYTKVTDVVGAAALSNGFGFIQVRGWFCARGVCPAVIAGRVIYADATHISSDAAMYFANRLAMALEGAISTQ